MNDNIDFNAMSLDELRALRKRIDRSISSFESRKRREAVAAANEAARAHGFSLADLTGEKASRTGASSSIGTSQLRYVNPNDASQTWSGAVANLLRLLPSWTQGAI